MRSSRLPLPSAAAPIGLIPVSFCFSLIFWSAPPFLQNRGIVLWFLQFDQLEQILSHQN
jgi:hypothetical protein